MKGLREVACDAVTDARRYGAQEAAAGSYRARHVEISWRDGKLERVTEATTRGLGLEVYVDGRYGAATTSDLRPAAVERFIEVTVNATRRLEPDPDRVLPDSALYEGQAQLELELEDPGYGALDTGRRKSTTEALEAAARSVSGAAALVSVTASFGDTAAERFQVHSNGFEGTRRATDFGMAAEVSARDPDGRRPEDWEAASARFLQDLPEPGEVGRRAAERALARIGAKKGETAVLPMVIDRRAAGRLVAQLLGPMSAAALQQKRSFLDGRLNERIGGALLAIDDDPFVKRGFGSRLFDGEGIAAKRFPLFEDGLLRNYFVDTYYGRKLGMKPTTARMSNLAWRLGEKDVPALLASISEGVLVTGFLGGNSNGTTGDFSLGVQGFRIRNGAIAEPIAEMNVSGNHLELWKRLVAVGNDPYRYSAMRTPTLVFKAVQFAGV